MFDALLTLLRARQLCFFYSQILPEFKNRFVLKEVDLICWEITKLKILYEISGIKFSSLELKLSVCAVQPPPVKGLNITIFLKIKISITVSAINVQCSFTH